MTWEKVSPADAKFEAHRGGRCFVIRFADRKQWTVYRADNSKTTAETLSQAKDKANARQTNPAPPRSTQHNGPKDEN